MENYNFYIINLDRAPHRWNLMKHHYDLNNVTRVSAYDGRNLQKYNDIVLPKQNNASSYEVACSLSHLKAIKMAYENQEQEVFILEDDIINTYKNVWNKSLREYISNKPEDCECLTFFNISPIFTINMIRLKNDYLKYDLNHWSTGCYYLNRLGLKKIYDKYIKNNKIDLSQNKSRLQIVADGKLLFNITNTYHLTKPTFIDFCQDSSIHPNHINFHRRNNNIIKKYFNSLKVS